MYTTIALLIVIAVIVFVHELGHFWAARWAGARVEVFSIGFGKALIKWKDKHGTEWRIAWLPLGGFVSIYGQDDMFNRKKYKDLSKKEKAGHYLSLPAWKQSIVIAAGVFMNLLTALIIYTGLFMGNNKIQLPVVGAIEQQSQFIAGDRVMQLNGEKIDSWSEMIQIKEMHNPKVNDVVILRGEKLVQLKVESGKWGIKPDVSKIEIVHKNIAQAFVRGGQELWTQSKMIFVVLGQIISGERSSKQLGGLISIAEISEKAFAAGFVAFMTLIALLSVNLAVINLFPLPVLDGGYLLILLIEAITGKKLQGKWIDWIMRIGVILLIALMVFALSNDITRLMK